MVTVCVRYIFTPKTKQKADRTIVPLLHFLFLLLMLLLPLLLLLLFLLLVVILHAPVAPAALTYPGTPANYDIPAAM